ncbi:hypothetical protein QSV37_01095 [Acinetobacter sp. VNK23]|uniref:hypothetical protein n=1 Tax=Acinetobacter thutiue TaxID=2998078 RepID=UPI002575B0EE|nr:hypothetical protein [Acinetobacter thutiue]MDM1018912.1 hypothetical protein [Acinetobacter thutiue]
MKKIQSVIVLMSTLALHGCKVVNHHTVKLTGSAEMQGAEIHLPIQCLKITTSEPFDMQNRAVHFRDFKFKKLPVGDSECRKIKVGTRISAAF